VRAFLLLLLGIAASTCRAQEIHIYSEFERSDPFGNPVAADRDMVPREILSPAMARNGHLSVRIVITGPSGSNYFLYAASNPPDIVELKLYREHFVRCGEGYCPDWLTPQNSPSFGAIPESPLELPKQTSRSYLLDIWARPDTPPRRVRVEALLKVGTWQVAPMEVRIVAPTVPNQPAMIDAENQAPVEAPSSTTARIQLLRYLDGLPPQTPGRILTVRDIIQRNAAEDMLLAHSLAAGRSPEGAPGLAFPEMNLMSMQPFVYPELGAEWYLRIRDFLYRFEP
jgi:hypothetical protein